MLGRLEQYGRHTSTSSEQLIMDIAQLIDIIGRRLERLVTFYEDQTESYPGEELLGEVRVGFVSRPWTQIAQEQIEILQNRLGFRWADIARMFGISSRTLVCRQQDMNTIFHPWKMTSLILL